METEYYEVAPSIQERIEADHDAYADYMTPYRLDQPDANSVEACPLCQGWGRIGDDIPCLRCDVS